MDLGSWISEFPLAPSAKFAPWPMERHAREGIDGRGKISCHMCGIVQMGTGKTCRFTKSKVLEGAHRGSRIKRTNYPYSSLYVCF